MSVNLDFSQHPSADGERPVKLFLSQTAHDTLRHTAKITGHSMSFVADAAIRALLDQPAFSAPDAEPEQASKPKQEKDNDEDFLGDTSA